jgi:hypothetical protein
MSILLQVSQNLLVSRSDYSDGRDRHTGAGSNVDRTEQGTRSSEEGPRSNVSASDLRQEPGAVVPHAGICAGGAG